MRVDNGTRENLALLSFIDDIFCCRRAAGSGADPDSSTDELFASFNMSRADALFLDYTIVDIRADRLGIEVDSSGEVSLRGRGGTPFGTRTFLQNIKPNLT